MTAGWRAALAGRHRRLPWSEMALACCLAGFALRLVHLEHESLWLDEGATYTLAQLPVAELVAATFSREPNPPLYFLLVHAWIGLAGSGELSLRLLSVMAGVANLALIHRLGRNLLGPAPALAAAILAASSPYLIWYAQEARMYALLASLATATLLALWQAFRRPAWPTWLGFGLLLLATLYTHFFGIFILFVSGALTLAALARAEMRRAWPLWVTAFTAVGLLYLPWLVASLQAGADRVSWRAPTDLVEIVGRSVAAFAHGGFLPEPAGGWLAGAEIALAAAGLLVAVRLGRGGAALLLLSALALPSLGVFVLSQRLPIFAERYVIAQAPFLSLAMAAGLTLPLRRAPLISLLVLAAVAASSLAAVREGWLDPRNRKEDFRAVASYLDRHAGPDDLVVLVADYVWMPFTYYYRGPAEVIPFAGNVQQPGEMLEPLILGRDQVWLLLSHAEQVDPDGRVHRWLAERYPAVTEQFPQGMRLYGYRATYRLQELPSDVVPLRLRFGDAVELAGYRAESGIPPTDDRLHPPSNWLHVRLYWRALAPVGEPHRSSVRLVDGRGVWGDRLQRPNETLAIFPTPRWQPGELVVEDADVNLNPATPPGTYGVEVRLLTPAGQPLPVREGSSIAGTVEITAR